MKSAIADSPVETVGRGARILVVADDCLLGATLSDVLRSAGHWSVLVSDLFAAERSLRRFGFDVVLIELRGVDLTDPAAVESLARYLGTDVPLRKARPALGGAASSELRSTG